MPDNITRNEAHAHLMYPDLVSVLDVDYIGSLPTFRARNAAFWFATVTSGSEEKADAQDMYLKAQGLGDLEPPGDYPEISFAAMRDLFRVANGANRALQDARVSRDSRGDIMKRSFNILDLADIPDKLLLRKSGLGITPKIMLDAWHLSNPTAVYFTKFAVPVRAFKYDPEANLLSLSDPYEDYYKQLKATARKYDVEMGCPAHRLRSMEDSKHPNMLADVWIRYIETVYDGNKRTLGRQALAA